MFTLQQKLLKLRKDIDSSNPVKHESNVQQLRPSTDAGKRMKYFNRMNAKVKGNFRQYQEIIDIWELSNRGPTGYGPGIGKKWHCILNEYISGKSANNEEKKVGKGVIDALKDEFPGIEFLQSEFPLYGYMTHKEDREMYFWNGKADAIGWYNNDYVIVDWKAVDLLNFWERNVDAYGKYLHQCLVYARLLQLHLKLDELPYILIVPINNKTGQDMRPGLFRDFPDECQDELDQYTWSTTSEPKTLSLPHHLTKTSPRHIENHELVRNVLKNNCTVGELLDALGFDELNVY